MSKVYFIHKRKLYLALALMSAVILALAYLRWEQSILASGKPVEASVFHLVTGEFSSTGPNGQKIEVYRWDPGHIVVSRGQSVELRITGVNGASHPFVIEGLGVRGTVRKGETTVVRFTPEHAGTYPIICLTHRDLAQNGPMVGYIRVQ
jgi:heme/copper-type cytochrome/quinol oxidase subunit 2